MELQSAIEFLSTYAFMIIMLALLIVAIFIFALPAQSTTQNQCNMYGGMHCSFVIYHPNSGALSGTANMIFYLTNSGSAPINVIAANVLINNKTFAGQCSSSFLNPGSSSICYAKVSPSSSIGAQVRGYLSITANYCNSAVSEFGNAIYQGQCNYNPVIYTGSFFTYSTEITANTIATTSIMSSLFAGQITPNPVSFLLGQMATLTVNPTGGVGTYKYTWYSQSGCAGVPVSGPSLSNTYTVSSSGTYTVKVVDGSGASSCSPGDVVTVITPSQSVSFSPPSPVVQSTLDTVTGTIVPGADPSNIIYCSGAACPPNTLLATSATGTVTYTLCQGANICPAAGTYTFKACDTSTNQCSASAQLVITSTSQSVSFSPISPINQGTLDTVTGTIVPGADPSNIIYCSGAACAPNMLLTTSASGSVTYILCQGANICPAAGTYVFEACDTSLNQCSAPSTLVINPVVHYVPVTLTNSQSTPTSAGFQQMVSVMSNSYAAYINGAWSNIEFSTGPAATGTILNSWVESGAANTVGTTTVVWVNLGSLTIPASGGTQTIYMNFQPMTTQEMSSSGPTGEAAQLSSPYAANDNGASVFGAYQRWGGLASVPSGWTNIASTFTSFNPTNTIFQSPSGGPNGYYGANELSPLQMTTFPTIIEFYGTMNDISATTSATAFGLQKAGAPGSSSYYLQEGAGDGIDMHVHTNAGGSNQGTTYGESLNTMKVYSLEVISSPCPSSATVGVLVNYASVFSSTTLSCSSDTSGFLIGLHYNGAQNPYGFTVYWTRTRVYPPSGIMPSVGFGSVT